VYCKSYSVGNNFVLACCDEEILGKNLVDEKYDVTITEAFYKGEKTSEEELAALLADANNINLFGERSVGVALKEGLITERDVIRIGGVPHAVIVRM